MPKLQLKLYYTIGLPNMARLFTLSLIVAPNISITTWPTLCTLMGIRHSPRTAYSPWTNGLVEVQNRNLGTHLRMFLHNTPQDWAFQVPCMLMHTIHNLFQNSMFLHMKKCSTQDPESHLLLISTLIVTVQKLVSPNIVQNFQNIHTMAKRT